MFFIGGLIILLKGKRVNLCILVSYSDIEGGWFSGELISFLLLL